MTLRAGDQVESFDITLIRAKTFCITSTIGNAGSPSSEIWVRVSEMFPMSQSRVAYGQVRLGDIEICGIPPGSYRILADAITSGRNPVFSSQIFGIAGRAVSLPTMYLTPAQQVHGKVTVSGAKPEDPLPKSIKVSLEAKDRPGIMGESLAAQLDSSGTLLIPRALLDDYWLRIAGLPPGYYVKQATLGQRDGMREPVHVGDGELRIVLDPDGPSLTGRVTDEENQPISGASVILAADPLPSKVAVNELLTAVSGDGGQFSLSGMAPGSYRLMAFTGLPEGQAGNPEYVRVNLIRATEVDLSPRQAKSVTVVALPAPLSQ